MTRTARPGVPSRRHLVFLALAPLLLGAAPQRTLRDLQIESRGRAVVLTLVGGETFPISQSLSLPDPPRCVIDLAGVREEAPARRFPLTSAIAARVRISQFRVAPDWITRIVLDLSVAAPCRVTAEANRLTVELSDERPLEPASAGEEAPAESPAAEARAGLLAPTRVASSVGASRRAPDVPPAQMLPAPSDLRASSPAPIPTSGPRGEFALREHLTLSQALERASRTVEEERQAQRRTTALDSERFAAEALPTLRAEAAAIVSQTPELFTETPYRQQWVSGVLALDLSLWDGGARRARREGALAQGRYLDRRSLDTDRIEQIVSAFADLYVARLQMEGFERLGRDLDAVSRRSVELLETGDLSKVPAAEAQDSALAAQSEALEADTRRLEAESRLKSLIGFYDSATIVPELDGDLEGAQGQSLSLDDAVSSARRSDSDVARESFLFERQQWQLRESAARLGPRLSFGGYGGVGAARSTFAGTTRSSSGFPVYGLRLSLTVPIFDRPAALEREKALAETEQQSVRRAQAQNAAAARAASRWLAYLEAGRRVDILIRRVAVAREREQSVARLVAAGARRPASEIPVSEYRARQEMELSRARVERWKLAYLLQAGGGPR